MAPDVVGITLAALLLLVALALVFVFLNGFHDAANSIATIVSTGVLRPWQAVLWAGGFNFAAIAVFHTEVAATVGQGIVAPAFVDHRVLFAALTAAIAWNLLTWWRGLPSSSTHALVGGLIGATLAAAGSDALVWTGISRTALFILVSPAVGLILGAGLALAIAWLFFRMPARRMERGFRRLQLLSSALYSLGHGSNGAQKTMGILWLLMLAADTPGARALPAWLQARPDHLPAWVEPTCYAAIASGTLFGGWRIVRTMGERITRLTPAGGFAAETGGAAMLFAASALGIPVSTTQTIAGAVVGVGASRRLSSVNWHLARVILRTWVLTIPAAAILAAAAWWMGGFIL